MDNIVRVDLGCGHTKAEGYLGIDRFLLSGVDIAADVNNGIPLEDNSVDIMLCSHSLEHFDNIYFIMEEIYRVCKHGALIYVLSPYHMETVNFANFYHKQVFNEATFRFFTSDSNTSIDKRDYYNPHAYNWGLGSSDNSQLSVNIHTVSMEYFYFPDYIDLSEEEKRNARRSLQNVCDQIYYVLAVNKSGSPFTLDEVLEFKKLADENEPDIIQQVRNREINQDMGTSILSDIKKWNDRLEKRLDSHTNDVQISIENAHNDINEIKKKLYESEERLSWLGKRVQQMEKDQLEQILKIKQENEKTTSSLQKLLLEKNSLASSVLELMEDKETPVFKWRQQKLFRKGNNIYSALASNHFKFIDGLTFLNNSFNRNSILTISNTVPYSKYFEYSLSGVGSKIYYFLFSNIGANLLIELVQNGTIIQQMNFTVTQEGMQVWELEREVKGGVLLRFRVCDNYSIVRLLEISSRKIMFLSNVSLAAYITNE
ncbi:methyltransferase domain-containing protein [Paenibacillus sp. FSL F4-0125]|uniref:class I SAM-dependent methyltransferase n=1 Tax=Paenibacillus sp. FSL F4-0125 TaxID=2954730 RepID=UPI0030FADD30